MASGRSDAEIEKKWGKDALSLGWTPIPTALLLLQNDIGLTAVEMNILIHLLSHWWKVDDKVYPSQDSIAGRMGVSKRTVQRGIDRLESLKIIEVQSTPRSGKYHGKNIYDLRPLSLILEQNAPHLRYRVEMTKGRKVGSSHE